MNATSILHEALRHQEYSPDLFGVGKKAYPEFPKLLSAYRVAEFISKYNQMWHDVGIQDPERKLKIFKDNQSLYLDEGHKIMNPNLRPLDYLFVFKEFHKQWAAKQNTYSPMLDWEIAQEGLAKLVKSQEAVLDEGFSFEKLSPETQDVVVGFCLIGRNSFIRNNE